MKTTRLLSLICTALSAFVQSATAAPGDLDLTFGGTGKVTTAIGLYDKGYCVAVQSDGKIIVGGSSSSNLNASYPQFALARYNLDGSLDTTFNGSGKVITAMGAQSVAQSIAIQNDGKILATGQSDNIFVLVRYNPNGSLDTAFNGTGKVTTGYGNGVGSIGNGRSVVIQPDGKIVVAGTGSTGFTSTWSDFALARFNVDGSLDAGFNNTGVVTTDFGGEHDHGRCVALQNDGKIIVAGESYTNGTGTDFALVRYNTDGSLDTTFNVSGKVTTSFGPVGGSSEDIGYSIAIQDDEKIVVAGQSSFNGTSYFGLARYNTNGSLDASFGGGGTLTTAIGGYSSAKSVALQSDGKIVAAGGTVSGVVNNFAIVRYNSNGSLDTAFHGTGIVTTDFNGGLAQGAGLALRSDGKLVVAGDSYVTGEAQYFALARYEGDLADTDGDGIPDIYETGTGIYVSPTDTGTDPHKADTDGDGLTDGQEMYIYHTNPNVKDTDGDGFDDGFEVATGFDPNSVASTPDAQSSIRVAAEYRFNAALGISYRIEYSTDLANWSTLETPIIGSGGVVTRFYSIEGQPKRFFRSRRN